MTMQTITENAPLQTQTVAVKSSFYLAMRILEPARRDAMYAIYTFCRAVDDIADDEGDRAMRRDALDDWRRDLDELYAGRILPRTPFSRTPSALQSRPRRFQAVIDGMMMDVEEDICAPEWEKLELYCDRVASAVGRLSVRAFGLVDDNGPELSTGPKLLAYHLGRALQLTNILRDLDEDARAGGSICRARRWRKLASPTRAARRARESEARRRLPPVMQRAREHFEQSISS